MSLPLSPENFINRELAWLEFNGRVLEEAKDPTQPLLERVKFLSIVSSNLDEFFEIRVAGLMQQEEAVGDTRAPDGLTPAQQLKQISEKAHAQVAEQTRLWMEEIAPALQSEGLVFVKPDQLDADDQQWAADYFEARVSPVLTPLAVDPAHPFPLLLNKSLNLALALVDRGHFALHERLGLVPVPRSLPGLVPMPTRDPKIRRFMLLDDLMRLHVEQLFPGQACLGVYPFRVTRNSNLYVDEDEADNLLEAIETELRQRRRGQAVRLEIARDTRPAVLSTLIENLGLTENEVYETGGPVNLQRVLPLSQEAERSDLRDPVYSPPPHPLSGKEPDEVFTAIRHKDILLHHPYESFSGVLDFLSAAAEDPNVLAIKQTLYRTSADSPIVQALVRAAEKRKQVTVLMELKARFDEENNILLARMLEEAGAHVVYGLVGLKTHCKVALVVRQEGDDIRRYVHLGTGNYNPFTAKLYTDLGLITSRAEMGRDVASLFNMLTGFSSLNAPPPLKKLLVAPMVLGRRILQFIHREAENARAGKPARMIAKMNALVDGDVIEALYEASQAGVDIELIVRGPCCLRPGLPGISERIRVRSVVDRFLEHSRIYYFENGGVPQVWLGSADWMPRNFQRRVEVLFPVDDSLLKQRVLGILAVSLADNVKTRLMDPDGSYRRAPLGHGDAPFRSQQVFMDLAQGREVAVPGLPALPDGSKPKSRSEAQPAS